MARLFKYLLATGLVLAVVVVGLYVIPSDQYIFLPDKARPLAPFVTVKGERSDKDGGGIYYVAVEVKKASILEKLFHGLHEGSTLVPAAAIRAPGESDAQHQRVEIQAMSESQKIGAAVALRSLGYRVPVKVLGTLVAQVAADGPSSGKLEPGDRIVAIDGQPTKTAAEIRSAIAKHRPGETVEATVSRNGAQKKLDVKTMPDPKNAEAPADRRPPPERDQDLVAGARAHRPRPGGWAVRGPRICARRRRGAGPRHRPRTQGGRERRDSPGRYRPTVGAGSRRRSAQSGPERTSSSSRLGKTRRKRSATRGACA